jgi:hypothetical protein
VTSRGDRLLLIAAGAGVLVATLSVVAARAITTPAKVVVFSLEEGKVSVLWSVGLDGSGRTRLGVGEQPRVSPDGRWIVFYRRTKRGSGEEVRVMPTVGGRSVLVRAGPGLYASWLPDSKRLLVHEPSVGLLLIARDGSATRMLAPQASAHGGINLTTATSNGRIVPFARSTVTEMGPRSDVFGFPLASGQERNLTKDRESGGPLVGARLVAFVRYTRRGHQLWTMRPDGSSQQRLAPGSADIQPIAWLPGGRRLIGVSIHLQGFSGPALGRIWVVDAANRTVTPLTPWRLGLLPQAVSRDGRTLLTSRGCGGGNSMEITPEQGVIEAIPISGGSPRMILRGPCSASWNA